MKFNDKSLKDLCEIADSFEKITTAAGLKDALPNLIQLGEAMKTLQALVKTSKKAYDALSDKCSAYAVKHDGCFENGLTEMSKGVLTGDMMIDDINYHFAYGFDGIKRIDGENMTKAFFDTLPGEWVKNRPSLDVTGINRDGVSDDELSNYGLKRQEKCVWTKK